MKSPAYTVIHGRRSLQLTAHRPWIPAADVQAFSTATQCAEALSSLLALESDRVEAACQAARQQGFAQGRQEGERLVSDALGHALVRLATDLQAQQSATRQAVDRLALAVVQKLAATLGSAEVVPALIEQALSELLPVRATRIRVGPCVLAAAQSRMAANGIDAEVRADESLGEFDCVVESAQGQILVSLEIQLDAVSRALRETAAQSPETSP